MARTKATGESTSSTIAAQTIQESDELEKKLIAVLPILFESHQYEVGDQLPVHNHEMRELWIEAGAAQWMTRSSAGGKNDDV